MKTRKMITILALLCLLLGTRRDSGQAGGVAGDFIPRPQQSPGEALGSAFTYQGYLTDNGNPADGAYDFHFSLWDAASGGSQVGSTVSVDDFDVDHGYFTAALDFGASPFAGEKRWLQIEVRPGAETGAYTALSPLQELTGSPYALNAPWVGLSGVPAGFADDVDDNTTYTAGSGLNLVGSQFRADTSYLQRRVAGVCPAGQSIQSIDSSGNVTCETDDDHTYSAGSGLSLVGTTFSADTTYLQQRVTGSCQVGSTIQAINADGSVTCEQHDARPVYVRTPVSTLGAASHFIAVAIGRDGMPIIVVNDQSVPAIKIHHCANLSCTLGQTNTLANGSFSHPSIAIGSDGLPVVSMIIQGGPLQIAHCSDLACTASSIVQVPSAIPLNGTSIAIGVDGFALITFREDNPTNQGRLVALHCNDLFCSTFSYSLLDPLLGGTLSAYSSVAIGADGLGLINYSDTFMQVVKVAHCNDVPCSAATITVLAPGPFGYLSSSSGRGITIGSDGMGIIAFHDNQAQPEIWTARCNDLLCALPQTFSTLVLPGVQGGAESITIGDDGLPVITFYDWNTFDLIVAHCSDNACQNYTLTSIATAGINDGWWPQIAIGTDGMPLIASTNLTTNQAEVTHCTNVFCIPHWQRP